MSRTRKILDVLDQLASSASLANDSPNTSTNNSSSLLNTRKWLHDISVGRMPGGGPPRTTLRTPSRLYSIISNIRDKPYWKRPTEMAAAAEKRKEVSFEADTEPDAVEAAASKTNNSELPKTHQPVLKSYTGRNVAGSLKSNIFNTDIVDLEADISSMETTKKSLESVKPPTEFGKNLQSGFLTKNRIFNFAKPIIRGPQAVVEKSFEKGDSSSEDSSMDSEDDEESDKEIEIVSTKATNSDTSTSSPENSKSQKPPSPAAIAQQTPLTVTNTAGSWECPTCWCSNKASDDKCLACQTPKEGTTNTVSSAVSNNTSSWECSECWVNNKASDDKCVSCQTPKQGSGNAAATSNNAAPQPVFKATQFKPVSTSVSFGFKPPDTSAPKPANATNGISFNSNDLFNTRPNGPTVAPVPSTESTTAPLFSAPSTQPPAVPLFSAPSTQPIAAPSFSAPVPSSEPAAAPTISTPAPSFPVFGQQNSVIPKSEVDQSPEKKPALNSLFSFNSTAPVSSTAPASGFNFGVKTEQPSTNGTFQFNGLNGSSNLFNLPLSGAAQPFSAPAPSLPVFGQQNNMLPKTDGDQNLTSQAKTTAATPFSFNTAAPVSGFNFGNTTEQPSSNGTFQFNGSNSSSNLFNLPLTGAAQPFSAPAPSFPVLGQQNAFMPITGGTSSSNRKIILAKRQRKR